MDRSECFDRSDFATYQDDDVMVIFQVFKSEIEVYLSRSAYCDQAHRTSLNLFRGQLWLQERGSKWHLDISSPELWIYWSILKLSISFTT